MAAPVFHSVYSNTFWLSPHRCIFWEQQQALIISDLHLGKTGHFRKMGIAVPQAVYKEDLQRLFSEIQYYKPNQLIIVGDLFHSHQNKEMDLFLKWRNDLANLDITLVKGNHDILKQEWYDQATISVAEEALHIGQFVFRHDANPLQHTQEADAYTFSGHIHPGVSIRGLSRQSLTFPCFHFGRHGVVLPAFSKFTGVHITNRQADDHIYAIVNKSVVRV